MIDHDKSRPTAAMLMVCAAIAVYSLMDAVMKQLVLNIGAYNAMFWRCMLGAVIMGAIFVLRRSRWPAVSSLKIHLRRSIVAAGMALTFFWALGRLPMAEAIALTFLAPLMTLYLASALLGERVPTSAYVGSVVSLLGVVVILSGKMQATGLDAEGWLAVGALFVSAVLYAYNLILARTQAQMAGPLEIAFFQNLLAGVVFGLAAPWFAIAPSAADAAPIALSTVLAIIGLLLMSWGYARAEARLLAPLEYTAFIWASIFGWIVFRESVTAATIVGAALIIGGCLYGTRQRPEHAVEPGV